MGWSGLAFGVDAAWDDVEVYEVAPGEVLRDEVTGSSCRAIFVETELASSTVAQVQGGSALIRVNSRF